MACVRLLGRPLLGLAMIVASIATPSSATAQFGDLAGGSGPGPSWKVKVDPPALPLSVAAKELAIPIPQGFGPGGGALFPSTASPFVALGYNEAREVWDLRTKARVGGVRGKLDWSKHVALSPDGQFLAGLPTFRTVVEVRSTKNGRVVQTIDPIKAFANYLDFGHKDQVVGGKLDDKSVQVWSLKTGDPLFDINFPDSVDRRAVALSPGRRYFLAYTKGDSTLRAFDLAERGKPAGELSVSRGDGDAFNPDCVGIAFSNDGADLAAVFEQFGKVRIVAWSVPDGRQLADVTVDPKSKDKVTPPPFYDHNGVDGVQWLPDKSGWLAFGSSIVDRESGRKVYSLPYDGGDFTISPRRFVDDERALIVFGGGKTLRTAPIPVDKLRGAMKIARSGGNAADALLPPLKKADWSTVKAVTFPQKSNVWSARPDPAPSHGRLATRPIPLKTKLGEIISVAVSGPSTAQALVAASPTAFGKPDKTDGVNRWVDRYDLAGGRHLGRVDIPAVSELVAFSPDATRFVVLEAKAKDRLDAFDVLGKPVVGWRPYEQEAGDGRAVAFAAFLDADRLVTLSGSGRLVLWSLPAARAIYAVDDAFRGPPALSPGRSTLVGYSGEGVRFLDAATGAFQGEVAASFDAPTDLKASAFRIDGGEWAGLFGNGQLLRLDVKGARFVDEFKAPVLASILEYAGPALILADGKSLIDLANRRAVWAYESGPSPTGSPDGRHWFACAKSPNDPAMLAAIALPERGMDRMSTMLADPKTPAIVRPGDRVSLALDFGGAPRKADEFRKAVHDLAAAKLSGVGLTVAPGQAATITVRVVEKNTGQTMELEKIGIGAAPGGPFNRANHISIPVIDLDVSLVVSQGPTSVVAGSTTLGMRTFFPILHLPAGETDIPAYLKDRQWDGLKRWLETTSMPYYVARSGAETVRLPGFTDLNALLGRAP